MDIVDKSPIHRPLFKHKANEITVTLPDGTIQGLQENGVRVFKGIPYAQPPLGSSRFRAPAPITPWQGTLRCTDYKSAPLQVLDIEPGVPHSEDCLYLNLWAPETASATQKYPVLVFIHGGGFAKGSPSKHMYDGTHFAQNGVIQINIAYRLNALGFMAFSGGSETGEWIANSGFLDQICALKWVQRNIEYFGGDPEKVTVSGESAGSFSVSNLIMSPLAKGLFARAIMESGNLLGQPIISPRASGCPRQAIATTQAYCHFLGAANFTEMQQISAKKIVRHCAFHDNLTRPPKYNFWPVFDGVSIPENPYQALCRGKANAVDILAGYNTDEGTLFVPDNITAATYHRMVEDIFKEQAEAVLSRFPVTKENTPTMRARALIRMGFRFGNDVFARELTKQGRHAYLYNFDYDVLPLDIVGLRTMHALELAFVFKTIPALLLRNKGLDEFSTLVHTLWANFIKTGNPNTGTNPGVHWPEYQEGNRQHMVLNAQTHPQPLPLPEDVDFYCSLLWQGA